MAPKTQIRGAKGLFFVAVAVVVGITLANGLPGSGASEPTAPRKPGEGDVAGMAKGTCRVAVPRVMNDPDSIDFDPMDSWTVDLGEDHRHLVRLGLRAKNAFNATIYARFDCLVEDRGEEWEAISAVQAAP